MRTNETIVVNSRSADSPAAGGFRVQDLWYGFFRHKWKILILTVLGLVGGAAVYLTTEPTYVSEARLLIRYVLENRSLTPDDQTSVRTPDSRGDNIINSELEILTSFDRVKEVVEAVGATNIVTDPKVSDPLRAALSAVKAGIDVQVPRRSNILRITFENPDPQIARMVLSNVVDSYLKAHARVHRALDALNDVAREVDKRRGHVEQTEADLRRLKNDVGVVSIEDTKKTYLEQIARIRTDLLNTEAELAERRAAMGIQTNSPSSLTSNQVDTASATTVPPDRLSEYRSVLTRIESLSRREQELTQTYTPLSPFVRATRDLLAEAHREKEALERATPALPQANAAFGALPRSGEASNGRQIADPAVALSEIRASEARLVTLTSQLAQLKGEVMKVTENESEISKLQRQLEVAEKQYLDYTRAYDLARSNEELSQGKIANIRVIQYPVPARPNYGTTRNIAAGLAGGGLLLGIALAILIELQFDQSIRRPGQVERNLRLPLFLSVPRLKLGGKARALPQLAGDARPESSATEGPENENANGRGDELPMFTEALRDRLMMHFQLHGLNHKPKLVGVTSCGRDAGVTTLATGLAASLSETGDGNVLYVDVNPARGPSVHPFQRGKAVVGIRSALEEETRDSAKVQDNLYMVSLADPASRKIGVVPKTLAGLVPKMKASDYDYIIFDLPPITQTSATAKVAGLLDITFLVLESEKTQCELARKASNLLSESRANVAAVLNKHRRYLPQSVDTDL